jgi:hypothetical protein
MTILKSDVLVKVDPSDDRAIMDGREQGVRWEIREIEPEKQADAPNDEYVRVLLKKLA